MNIDLKEFQEKAVAELLLDARLASGEATRRPQALSLSAPTGSGKTVIVTRLLERLLEGDEEQAGDGKATFLWLTDQPQLNEQTRKKFLATSSVFGNENLVTIGANFDQGHFEPGHVYFLNTQRIGKDKRLVTQADLRDHTIWETIGNTVAVSPGSFWLIIDEAHRGMAEPKEIAEAQSIAQRFIKGSAEIPPVPLVLGISATPARFEKLIGGTTRVKRPYEVSPEDVRASGLLKEVVVVTHAAEKQKGDWTMLAYAARELEQFREQWGEYSVAERERVVEPLLVVQIENERSGSKEVSKTDLAQAMRVLERELGPLGDDQVAHSLQQETPIPVDGRLIRFVAPSDIEEDKLLRVVFFKMSLNAGWDCPRAEVMMSFRAATDHTAIAQLIGRMVRTPLARLVSTSDFLNSVSLYLPYYDRKAVKKVVDYLTKPDAEVGLGTEVRQRELTEFELKRRAGTEKLFEFASTLPTYSVERLTKQSNVKRLLRLGRYLAYDQLDKGAPDALQRALVTLLKNEKARMRNTAEFKQALEGSGTLSVDVIGVAWGQSLDPRLGSAELKVVEQNIEDLYNQCARQLGEGLHAAYVKARTRGAGKVSVSRAKVELWALLQSAQVVAKLEAEALRRLKAQFTKHNSAIRKLPDGRQQAYRKLRRLARKPEADALQLRDSIFGDKEGTRWTKHLYVDADGAYHCTLNGWEEEVLQAELKKRGVVGWFRNPPRKDWSLTIPYRMDGEDRAHYPDLLVFRKQATDFVCDILEPHALAYGDSLAKAQGLAEYAKEHVAEIGGSVKLITKTAGKMKALDLTDEATRDAVLALEGPQGLKNLFDKA